MKWDMLEEKFDSKMKEHESWHHNYCRNPNGLKNRPWCLVSPETFQFCDVPLCKEPASSTTDEPIAQCAAEETRCGESKECIATEFFCDYEVDCANGADELNCPDWMRNFTFDGEFELSDSIIEIWTHIPHPQGCARRCLDGDAFGCASFSYNEVARVCALARSVSRSSLRSKPKSAFYKRVFDFDKDSISSRTFSDVLQLRKGVSAWAPFCSANYTRSNEEYVCQSFGFQTHMFAMDRGRFVRNDGSESELLDVPHWSAKCLRSSSCMHPDVPSCPRTLRCTRCVGEQFACNSGECISALNVCDGNVDCTTGDDEHNCDQLSWRLVNMDESDGDQLEVQHHGVWRPVCADSLLDSYIPLLCAIVNSSVGSQFLGVRSPDNILLGWRIKCTQEKCVLDGQKRCATGAARLRCSFDDDSFVCGKRHVDMIARDPRKQRYARVVGGFDALPAAFPWTAAIRVRRNHTHHCGASVLSNKFLLTAAHCFDEEPSLDYYEVIVGDWDSTENDGNEQTRNMKRIIRHPAYRDLFADDLAIIELDERLRFGKHVQPICLPPTYFDYSPGRKCVVSGWGSLGEASSVDYPKILQAAMLPILPRKECVKSSSIYELMSSSAFCAGYLTGGIDTCQGDSGGPFACQINDVYYLGGVISWGDGCALRGRPGIYTKVVPYIDWIKRVTNM
ncbi:unnamed protein product [Toxocara canis]|nr:unnamed protein product [Toxocara canis]